MAYMDEMALERERSKQALIAGKQPLLGDDTTRALHTLGVNLGVVPPGTPPSAMSQLLQGLVGKLGKINIDASTPLQVAPEKGGRTPSTDVNRYSDGGADLGGTLKGILDAAKGMGKRPQQAPGRTTEAPPTGASLSHMVGRGRRLTADQPVTATPVNPQDAIPGLRPGSEGAKVSPSLAAAESYMTQREVPKTSATVGTGGDMKLAAGRSFEGVNPQFAQAAQEYARVYHGQNGQYDVTLTSGKRSGDAREHGKGNAFDMQLVDKQTGKPLQNYQTNDPKTFKAYQDYANGFHQFLEQKYPDLAAKHRWGGYFSGGKETYGSNDVMHHDLAGDRVGMAGGSWKDGLSASQLKHYPGLQAGGGLSTWKPPGPQQPYETSFGNKTTAPGVTATAAPAAGGGASEITPELMKGIKQIESGGNPNLTKGSYKGLYQLSDKQFADYGGKGSIFDPAENERVAKLVIADEAKNLSASLGRPVTSHEIYMAHQQGAGGAAAHLKNPDQAAWKSMYSTTEGQQKGEAWAKQAIWGNVPDDMKARYGSVENMTSKQFTDMWKEKGTRLGIPDTPAASQTAAPAADKPPSWLDKGTVAALPEGVTNNAANIPPQPAQPAATVFDKGAPAVPVAGVGALQQPDVEAGTTATHTVDPATAALNAVKPPEAAVPPVAAAAVAPPPPQPAARVMTPPPAPPPAAVAATPPPPARPAAPPPAPPPAATGVSAAHQLLDTNMKVLAQKFAPDRIPLMTQMGIDKQTLRQALGNTMSGNAIREGITPHLEKQFGVKPADFERAYREPSPGKRADAGTSDATDFSARSRTPMAPPGLDGKVPTPQPRPEGAPNLDPGSQPAVQNANGDISTVRTMGFEDNGRQVNVPSVPAEGGRIMSNAEAYQRYKDTGKHLGKYDTVEQAGAAAEALHQQEAQQISQHPQGPQQPQVTPEMAKALENAFKDEARIPQGPPPPPEALPVPPVNNLPQGVPGGPQGGLSLAPGGLSSLPTNALMPATAGSQGGSIATMGLSPLPAIENSTYSTPLLDQMATSNSMFGSSSLSPISPTILGGWGWGGGSGFNMGGGGGGFDFGGGGGMVMPEMSFGAGG